MSKQKTAINFLVAELIKYRFIAEGGQFSSAIIEKAKEIEKKQIVDHHTWLLSGVMHEESARKEAEQYYQETYEQ